ncbi:30S ribosomal protein S6 [Candidatus Saccharibacteria bacterium]|nr:30S ribosomal protein S6 [Candidatus Saccharibacteria bacterium]
MKDYELTVLFHPDLEMNLDPALDKVKKIVESAGGKITKEENEGKKRLAYSIDGQEFAIYDFFDVSLPAEAPAKISSTLNITDEILRYLLVRVDERKAKFASRRAARAPKEAEESSNSEKGE